MSKPELLILDDEKEILKALNRVLRKDFELFLFSEPHQALSFYTKKPVPLIISDMRMPIMDGAKFLARIAELNPNSKRFILTGHADINSSETAINQTVIERHFSKPWDNDELISALHLAYEHYISAANTR